MPTPLSELFYAAWRKDGRPLKALSAATGLTVPTVSAYLNGTRGASGQRRAVGIIQTLAAELGIDEDAALQAAGLSAKDGVAASIDMDPHLSASEKAGLKAILRTYRQHHAKP